MHLVYLLQLRLIPREGIMYILYIDYEIDRVNLKENLVICKTEEIAQKTKIDMNEKINWSRFPKGSIEFEKLDYIE